MQQAIALKLRAKAMEMGLDPNTACPEDIDVLEETETKDGKPGDLVAERDFRLALNRLTLAMS